MLVGVCAATQAAMLASIGREKSAYEATWINMAAAIAGIALLLVLRGIGGGRLCSRRRSTGSACSSPSQ